MSTSESTTEKENTSGLATLNASPQTGATCFTCRMQQGNGDPPCDILSGRFVFIRAHTLVA